VIEAGSGGEALGLVDGDIDLVVLDVNIPGLSGLDIARLLRKCDDTTPIVLMTAYPARELAAEAERLGIALLAKPFALDRLSDEASSALSRNTRAVS
jgi:DNA-binding response OmpR family regulator